MVALNERIGWTASGNPKFKAFSTVPRLVKMGVLLILAPSRRNSRRSRSETWNDRDNERLMAKREGPGMVLRPASPKRPAVGGGRANAPLLKKPEPPVMGSPVASARLVPRFPLPPASERFPRMRAVNG